MTNKIPPEFFWQFFSNGWEFLVQILSSYYMFIRHNTNFYSIICNFDKAILSATTQFTSYARNVHHRPKRKIWDQLLIHNFCVCWLRRHTSHVGYRNTRCFCYRTSVMINHQMNKEQKFLILRLNRMKRNNLFQIAGEQKMSARESQRWDKNSQWMRYTTWLLTSYQRIMPTHDECSSCKHTKLILPHTIGRPYIKV